MVELRIVSHIILFLMAVVSFFMGLDYLILNFNPVWLEIRTVLEQVNINQNGVLSASQMEYLSHLAQQYIVYYYYPTLIVCTAFCMLFVLFWILPPRFFKELLWLVIPLLMVFSFAAIYFSKEDKSDKHAVLIRKYPSENYFLQIKKKNPNNADINDRAYSFRKMVSEKDLERFFEDQNL